MIDPHALILASVLGGAATYAIRFVPMALAERLKGRAIVPALHRFLLALGPCAIAAMLALSLQDMLGAAPYERSLPPIAAAMAAVWATHRATRNPAWATIAGTLVYGLALAVVPS